MTEPAQAIEVVDYDPDWPRQFADEATAIYAALPEDFAVLHHIGSTSVPGLAAKPVIDMMLEVDSLDELDEQTPALESLGYQAKGEFGIPERRFFLKGPVHRTHHIHAFVTGSFGALRHLAVRNFLREHPEEADDYAALKKHNAAAHRYDMDGYCDAKHDFVQALERDAMEWASRR